MGVAWKRDCYAARGSATTEGRARLRVVVVVRSAFITVQRSCLRLATPGNEAPVSDQPVEHPREDDRNEEVDGSPIPDPTEERGTAEEDKPQAD